MNAKIKSLFLTGLPVALTALLLVVVFAWAWVEPTQGPPGGNVPAPINVGPTGQAKRGNLMLNTDGSLEYGLLIPYGKVGIGTITPATRLEVKATTDEILRLTRDGATYPVNFKVGTDGALVINANNTDVLTLKDGKVGIGTTEPEAKFNVETSDNTISPFLIEAQAIQFQAGGLAIPGNVPVLYIEANTGNVGIGKYRGPGMPLPPVEAKLDVRSGDSRVAPFRVSAMQEVTPGTWSVVPVFYIQPGTGNVGIGTTTPAAKLDVAGNAKIEGDLEVSGKIIGSGLTVCRPPGFDYDTICSIPVKAGDTPCPIWKDCDGDGYTYGNGDCDESCDTCYIGSTACTVDPDGRDQNCNGVIDEAISVETKTCGYGEPYEIVYWDTLVSACNEYCNGCGTPSCDRGPDWAFAGGIDETYSFTNCTGEGSINDEHAYICLIRDEFHWYVHCKCEGYR